MFPWSLYPRDLMMMIIVMLLLMMKYSSYIGVSLPKNLQSSFVARYNRA